MKIPSPITPTPVEGQNRQGTSPHTHANSTQPPSLTALRQQLEPLALGREIHIIAESNMTAAHMQRLATLLSPTNQTHDNLTLTSPADQQIHAQLDSLIKLSLTSNTAPRLLKIAISDALQQRLTALLEPTISNNTARAQALRQTITTLTAFVVTPTNTGPTLSTEALRHLSNQWAASLVHMTDTPSAQRRPSLTTPVFIQASEANSSDRTASTAYIQGKNAILDQALRDYLPRQHASHDLSQPAIGAHLKTIPTLGQMIATITQKPPLSAVTQAVFGRAITETLQKLTTPHFDGSKGNPLQLQHAMRQNGVFFENTLKHLPQPTTTSPLNTTPATPPTNRLTPSTNPTSGGSRPTNISLPTAITRRYSALPSNTPSTTPEIANTRFNDDQKHLLLQLLNFIHTAPQMTPQTLASIPASGLDALLALLFPGQHRHTDEKITAKANTAEQLFNTLKTLTQGALSKITHQQLQALLAQSGDKLFSQSMEINMRWGEQQIPLFIQIDEKRESGQDDRNTQQEPPDKNAPPKKSLGNRWQVHLEFEIPAGGLFCSQVEITGNRLKSKLWAEQPHLSRKIADHVDELQTTLTAMGIEVELIQLSNSKPLCARQKIARHLVDIKT